MRNLRIILPALMLSLGLVACGKESTTGPERVDDSQPQLQVHEDEGHQGVIVDTRQIFKLGYHPVEAEIRFADYPNLNETVEIDEMTSLGVLSIHRTDLSDEESTALANGVALEIEIRDGGGVILATHVETSRVLDDANEPVEVSSGLPFIPEPVALIPGTAYLIQIHGGGDVIGVETDDCYFNTGYTPDRDYMKFEFVPVPGGPEGHYYVHPRLAEDDAYWYEDTSGTEPSINTSTETPTSFNLVEDADGWIRFEIAGTDRFVTAPSTGCRLLFDDTGHRYRLISADINWSAEDRGTVFHQPIMPPAKLDFAYKERLRNCSAAELESAVGTSDSRTRTTTVGTSESLQLFSSASATVGAKVGVTVGAEVGADVPGIGSASSSVEVSAEVSLSGTLTTSETTTSENTFQNSNSETREVSRLRTLTVGPFTTVEVEDAIKTITGTRLPFTQIIRIRATTIPAGTPLAGEQIESLLGFNLFEGTVTFVGQNFVDVSVRGWVEIDQLFEATTNVVEIADGCE